VISGPFFCDLEVVGGCTACRQKIPKILTLAARVLDRFIESIFLVD